MAPIIISGPLVKCRYRLTDLPVCNPGNEFRNRLGYLVVRAVVVNATSNVGIVS